MRSDVGCGALGLLRLLSDGPAHPGSSRAPTSPQRMVGLAAGFAADEQLTNVTVVQDDLFASSLPEHAFDLVHARSSLHR